MKSTLLEYIYTFWVTLTYCRFVMFIICALEISRMSCSLIYLIDITKRQLVTTTVTGKKKT